MLVVARKDDLGLPEFVAFRADQQLPWMRRWELPFVLVQARLNNTMAVLDCTINPVGFEQRLRSLYPHILYRHHNPIRAGAFAAPFGVPDRGFDRVICVNTLEHLLRPQREALIAEMSLKLKPGGRLILTSDFYFDSSWDDPTFLAAGIMRKDRQEVFNGYNKTTFDEWVTLCAGNNLQPLVAREQPQPQEDDPDLYLNVPPHRHACIGGVFVKPGSAPDTAARRVLLALVTWNTREVSLESLNAYLQEAYLLRRMGHTPFICVCDNGSVDGTQQALRDLDPDIDVEHRFILNDCNRGSSIARNQILDYMQQVEADYILFMDGDIEIVPFSSIAMLRYMESNGSRLGCIGPYAWGKGQSNLRSQIAPIFYSIDPTLVATNNVVAWTQYGMFRRKVFEDGVRFEQQSPFDDVGWGFEDNDLVFQMNVKGYVNQSFTGMTYLHRDIRSSIRIMTSQGINARARYEARQRYVIDKWASVPQIRDGGLREVMRASWFKDVLSA
jgi:SAM-dependent methyltransferase